MKITAIRATCVNIPLETPFYWTLGKYPGTSKVIVEVDTDEGLTGIGEATSIDCAPVINGPMAHDLIGLDPFDLATCERCGACRSPGTLSLTEGNVEQKILRRHRNGALGV